MRPNVMEKPGTIWSKSVTVAEIPDTGAHYELTADAATRAAIAHATGLRDLPALSAVFDVTLRGDAVSIRGGVKARAGQTCVVTLEPIESDVHETVDLLFAPSGEPSDTGS